MAVAVQSEVAHRARTRVTMAHAFECLRYRGGPGCRQIGRYEAMGEEVVAWFRAEAFDVQRRPRTERRERAHRMDAADEASHPFQGFAVLQFGRAAAALGVKRKTIAAEMM